ncbi:FHA domain-containing protein [Coralloluteibacterium thermophilus]|uniref:FHA domain-containing protein n=1 Tax=Coralloluteibacterium thermophilum TaxID=2707049 RepID=A0ABV9NLS7_9GAMM
MRLTFPHGEHPDVPLSQERLTIGSGEGNAVVLPAPGIAARHAFVATDLGGTWLCLQTDAAPAHVNARPVRRLALLRPGDVVTLGEVRIVLSAPVTPVDDPQTLSPPAAADAGAGLRVVLRGVAGPHFGRAYALDVPRTIGRGAGADIRLPDPAVAERHVEVALQGDRVVLRCLGPDGCNVNGEPVRACELRPGDQVVIEQHRFVLEAPRRDLAAAEAAADALAAFDDMAAEPEEDVAAPREQGGTMVWWLLLAAAGLAAAITALLVYAPRMSG